MRDPLPSSRALRPIAGPASTPRPTAIRSCERSRRATLPRGVPSLLLVSLLSAATAPTAWAGNIVFNYQKSQSTGYPRGAPALDTLGGHTSPLNFDDGTKDGRTYQISLLPFGQKANPPDPVYEGKPANATINYDTVLTKAFGASYAFNYTGGFPGQNEFNVQSYSVSAKNGGQIGADMYAVYNPDKGDPAIDANLHWIQVIWNNWSSAGAGNTTGKVENIVDNNGAANPYYDTDYTAGSTTISGKTVFNFYDYPQRPSAELATYDFKKPIEWMAEDFLVVDTKKQNDKKQELINVYGGIEYGWQVTLQGVPEPGTLVLTATGLLFAAALFGRRSRRAVRPSGASALPRVATACENGT